MRPAYAPWFFAGTFGQAFFCLGLVAYARALEGQARRGFVVTGRPSGPGLPEPHRARGPARRCRSSVSCCGRAPARCGGGRRRAVAPATPLLRLPDHALLFAVALAVSAALPGHDPGRLPPAGRESRRQRLVLVALRARPLRSLSAGHLSLSALLAARGLLQIARGRASVGNRLVLLFLALASGLVLYGLLSQWAAARGVHLLNLVAPHHFWLYVKMAGGPRLGLRRGVAPSRGPAVPAAGRVEARPGHGRPDRLRPRRVGAATAHPGRARGLRAGAPRGAPRERPGLAGRDPGLPAPARLARPTWSWPLPTTPSWWWAPRGRKTVAVLANFANPYVEAAPREEATRAMLAALDAEDGASLPRPGRSLPRGLGAAPQVGPLGPRPPRPALPRPELRAGPFILYRVESPP